MVLRFRDKSGKYAALNVPFMAFNTRLDSGTGFHQIITSIGFEMLEGDHYVYVTYGEEFSDSIFVCR